MCTVTYLPIASDQYILTSNRDESAERSPQNLSSQLSEGQHLIFPRDTTAGGTWIAISDNNRVVCLLNGAFKKHQHQPPYRKSRGLLVLEFFDYPDAAAFIHQYKLEGMEPFTLLILENNELLECRWDETTLHVTKLNRDQPHIWSSATLYPEAIQQKRQQWFSHWWQQQNEFSQSGILDFHKNGGEGDVENDLIMNRQEIVQTVSITSICKKAQSISMRYDDLIHHQLQHQEIKLQRELLESYQK